MSDYATTECEVEVVREGGGPVGPKRAVKVEVGDVFECFDDAFSSGVVVGFTKAGSDWYARLFRPFAYAHLTGTTSPSGLLGSEEYDYQVKSLVENRRRLRQRKAKHDGRYLMDR